MPSWTKDQENAIYSKGGKIIVSAAAGSGKTAVLSERVIEYILNGGNVNDLGVNNEVYRYIKNKRIVDKKGNVLSLETKTLLNFIVRQVLRTITQNQELKE